MLIYIFLVTLGYTTITYNMNNDHPQAANAQTPLIDQRIPMPLHYNTVIIDIQNNAETDHHPSSSCVMYAGLLTCMAVTGSVLMTIIQSSTHHINSQ